MVDYEKVLELADKISWLELQGGVKGYNVEEETNNINTYQVNNLEFEIYEDLLLCEDIDEIITSNRYHLKAIPINSIFDILFNKDEIIIMFGDSNWKIRLKVII